MQVATVVAHNWTAVDALPATDTPPATLTLPAAALATLPPSSSFQLSIITINLLGDSNALEATAAAGLFRPWLDFSALELSAPAVALTTPAPRVTAVTIDPCAPCCQCSSEGVLQWRRLLTQSSCRATAARTRLC